MTIHHQAEEDNMAQSNDDNDIKWLYGKLKAKGYNIGSEADFKSSLALSLIHI